MNRLTLGVIAAIAILGAWILDADKPAITTVRIPSTVYTPVTTPVVSTTKPQATTTTTTTIPAFLIDPQTPCQEWLPLALEVGWPADPDVIRPLLQIIWRESRCTADADSGPDHGLLQINQIHKVWLVDFGWTHEDMKDPRKNLTFGLALWRSSGWKPWAIPST
jgi:hypothetical protein